MKISAWKSIAVLVVALFWGGLTFGVLMFANELTPGEGLRQILVFVAGMFTVVTLTILSRAVRMMVRAEDLRPEEVTRPMPPDSSPPVPPASSASPS